MDYFCKLIKMLKKRGIKTNLVVDARKDFKL